MLWKIKSRWTEAVVFSRVGELAANIHTIKCKSRLTIYLHLLEIIIRGILTLNAGQNSDQFTSMSEKPVSRGTISHHCETDGAVSVRCAVRREQVASDWRRAGEPAPDWPARWAGLRAQVWISHYTSSGKSLIWISRR